MRTDPTPEEEKVSGSIDESQLSGRVKVREHQHLDAAISTPQTNKCRSGAVPLSNIVLELVHSTSIRSGKEQAWH